MTTQELEQKAVENYSKADKKGKGILEEVFGKALFTPDPKSTIKTYADACKALGKGPKSIDEFDHIEEEDRKSVFAFHCLTIIARALNGGWTPNWRDGDEYKYYPWFEQVGSGVGFSYDGYGYGRSYSGVGSRLVYKTRELAEYAGKQFESIYNDFLSL